MWKTLWNIFKNLGGFINQESPSHNSIHLLIIKTDQEYIAKHFIFQQHYLFYSISIGTDLNLQHSTFYYYQILIFFISLCVDVIIYMLVKYLSFLQQFCLSILLQKTPKKLTSIIND